MCVCECICMCVCVCVCVCVCMHILFFWLLICLIFPRSNCACVSIGLVRCLDVSLGSVISEGKFIHLFLLSSRPVLSTKRDRKRKRKTG